MFVTVRTQGVAVAIVALAGLIPASSASSASAASGRDEISGKGMSAIAAFDFQGFNQGTTASAPAGGSFRASNPAVSFAGPITCLHVEGNRAGFAYPIDEGSTPEAAVGQLVMIFIEDNGDSGDKMGFLGPAPAAALPAGCAPGATPVDITEGGVEVRDAG